MIIYAPFYLLCLLCLHCSAHSFMEEAFLLQEQLYQLSTKVGILGKAAETLPAPSETLLWDKDLAEVKKQFAQLNTKLQEIYNNKTANYDARECLKQDAFDQVIRCVKDDLGITTKENSILFVTECPVWWQSILSGASTLTKQKGWLLKASPKDLPAGTQPLSRAYIACNLYDLFPATVQPAHGGNLALDVFSALSEVLPQSAQQPLFLQLFLGNDVWDSTMKSIIEKALSAQGSSTAPLTATNAFHAIKKAYNYSINES